MLRQKGSTLILVMVVISVVSILILALNTAITNRLGFQTQRIFKLKAQTSARSALSYWLYYHKSGLLETKLKTDRTLARFLDCKFKEADIEVEIDDDVTLPFFEKKIKANYFKGQNNLSHIAQLTYLEQRYSDYLVASLGDLILSGIPQESRFFLGPVFTGGN